MNPEMTKKGRKKRTQKWRFDFLVEYELRTYPSVWKVLVVLDKHTFQEFRIVYYQDRSSSFIYPGN